MTQEETDRLREQADEFGFNAGAADGGRVFTQRTPPYDELDQLGAFEASQGLLEFVRGEDAGPIMKESGPYTRAALADALGSDLVSIDDEAAMELAVESFSAGYERGLVYAAQAYRTGLFQLG